MSAAPQSGPRTPLFVERHTYRMRRLRDAARALPAFAAMLWLVPLLWGQGDDAVSASRALIYLFVTWALLAAAAAVLIAALARAEARVAASEEAARLPDAVRAAPGSPPPDGSAP